jgi:hypothetical protein
MKCCYCFITFQFTNFILCPDIIDIYPNYTFKIYCNKMSYIPWYLCIAFHDEASYGTTPCFLPCFASLRIVHFWLPLRYSLTFILKCYWEIIRHFITIYLESVIRVDINDIRTENKICKLKCNKAITALHCSSWNAMHKYHGISTIPIKRSREFTQKYFPTKIFPYIFHIKPLIFITFSWSHSLADFHGIFTFDSRIIRIYFNIFM